MAEALTFLLWGLGALVAVWLLLTVAALILQVALAAAAPSLTPTRRRR